MNDKDDPKPSRLRVSNGTVVQFADGDIWIHVAENGSTKSFSDPACLLVLAKFAGPVDPRSIVDLDGEDSQQQRLIAELQSLGALQWDEPEGSIEEMPGDMVDKHLQPLADSLDLLAGRCAIGPEVAEAIRKRTGVGLDARLLAASAGIIATKQALGAEISDWVQTQVTRLDIGAAPLSIQIGSGGKEVAGWVNIDLWPAQLAIDFRWGLPFADMSAERVYLSHVLEHAYYPNEALSLLQDIHRVLQPGGRVRIIVPDIEACIQAYISNDRRFFEGRSDHWPEWSISTRMESFLGFAGVGPHPGMFGDAHKWGYDYETVASLLGRAGFSRIERSTYQGSSDAALNLDHASAWASAKVDDTYYSLFVEAIR